MYKKTSKLLKILIINLIISPIAYPMQSEEERFSNGSIASQNNNICNPVNYIDPLSFYKRPNKGLNQIIGGLPPRISRLIYKLTRIR